MLDKYFNSIKRSVNKMSVWYNLLVVLGMLFILLIIYKRYQPKVEGFAQQEDFIIKKGTQIYDNFYADIYDDLFYKKLTNIYEVGSIINKTGPDSESLILDIGSGTGHTVAEFQGRGYNAIGVDDSQAMVELAQNEYPNYKYSQGSALNSMAYQADSFTHITCLDFTIYYMKDKRQFFDNCYRWLMPGGYLTIHLVNRDMFDPMVPAGKPFFLVSAQSVAKDRLTKSVVEFNNFSYTANFEIFPNDFAQFKEIFKDKNTGKVRQNMHEYYMPKQKTILGIAKDVGFVMLEKIDLIKVQSEYQYLYVLQKPN